MKLIVEIDDEIYKTWRREGKYASHSYAQKIILNGTPLPKGHGDLKDADRLLDSFFYEYCRYGDFGYRQAEDLIKSSLTIIEAADKSEVDGGGEDVRG